MNDKYIIDNLDENENAIKLNMSLEEADDMINKITSNNKFKSSIQKIDGSDNNKYLRNNYFDILSVKKEEKEEEKEDKEEEKEDKEEKE